MFLWNITETFRECTVVMLILELKMYIPEMFVTVSCTVVRIIHLAPGYQFSSLHIYLTTVTLLKKKIERGWRLEN